MRVQLIASPNELADLESPWNALAADRPLRSWDWLGVWWRHYGTRPAENLGSAQRQLHVLAVYDDAERLMGIAPWYAEQSLVGGRVLRPLGDGEVCTDHGSLICKADDETAVAAAIAESLAVESSGWDCLELTAVDADDRAIECLVENLQGRECAVSRRESGAYWAVELPPSWEDYLAANSKSHRKQLRQLERRVLESDRVAWHRVESRQDFSSACDVLIDLHQRRRKSLGEPGCFASTVFAEFHREVAERLLTRGQLRLSWLELDGTPAAAEYHLAGSGATYAYQGGVDPERLAEEPGRLSTILCLRAAIDEGQQHFDFMRGDEPYKAHWRATPHATVDIRVTPNRKLARLRGDVRQAAERVHDWVKQGARRLGR